MRRLPALLLGIVLAALSAPRQASAAAPTTSPQWFDVTAHGADPTGAADSTTAINATIALATAAGQPLYLPAGTYKVTSLITIDYSGLAGPGFRIISDGAVIDGTSIGGAGPVLSVVCSATLTCARFYTEGTLTVNGTTTGYVFALGRNDFGDVHRTAKLDQLIVVNNSSGIAASGCKFNNVDASDLNIHCTSQGGGAGVLLEQVTNSFISGRGLATGTSGAALTLENGASTGDTIAGFGYGAASNICLSITSTTAVKNVFFAPVFGCTTAINAPQNANGNTIIGATFSGTNQGPLSTGIALVGRGSLNRNSAPAVGTYTAAGVDDGLMVSSANATGSPAGWAAASLAVTLPTPSQVGAGWTIGLVTGGNKAVVATPPGGVFILAPTQLSSITLGPGNRQIAVLQSDGVNFQLLYASRETLLYNGAGTSFPGPWTHPAGPGYQLTQGDNATVISSGASSGPLAVTLPAPSAINIGWTVGLAPDSGNNITVSGGSIVPPNGGVVTSQTYAATAYAMAVLEFDGALFRVISVSSQLIDIPHGGTNMTSQFPGGVTYVNGAATGITSGNALTYISGIFDAPHTQFTDVIEQLSSSGNIIFGTGALPLGLGAAPTNNVAVGYQAMGGCTGLCTALANVAVGFQAGQNFNDKSGTFVGFAAGQYAAGGSSNTFLGAFAGRGALSAPLSPALTGGNNTCVGEATCISIHGPATFNTALGFNALYGMAQGNRNTAVGVGAGQIILTSSDNTLMGLDAYMFGIGSQNTIIGSLAGSGADTSTLDNNPAGDAAGQAVVTVTTPAIFTVGDMVYSCCSPVNATVIAVGTTTITLSANLFATLPFGFAVYDIPNAHSGTGVVEIGYNAGPNLSGAAVDDIAIGHNAATGLTTGSSNIVIGAFAAHSLTTGSGNILIGTSGLDVTLGGGTSNFLAIGGANPVISATAVNSTPQISLGGPTTVTGALTSTSTIQGTGFNVGGAAGANCNLTVLHNLVVTKGLVTTCN